MKMISNQNYGPIPLIGTPPPPTSQQLFKINIKIVNYNLINTGIFLENDFWPPPLLSILYMGLTGSDLT